MRRALAVAGVCLGLTIASPAKGQATDAQKALTAQALYDQAVAEMDAKSFASACRRLEEVTRLVPEGIGARMTLGECYESLGKRASAWSQYTIVQAMAARAGQPERSQRAASKAAELKPDLATLRIEVPTEARAISGLTITRDGLEVGEAQWGTPLPIDAGEHEIVITAPDHKPTVRKFEVVADGARSFLKIKPLEPLQTPKVQPAITGLPPVTSLDAAPPDMTWLRTAGKAAIAAGALGIAGGSVVGIAALQTKNDSDAHCDTRSTCDPVGIELRSHAADLGTASTVALIAGAAVLSGGLVLTLTAPPKNAALSGPQTKAQRGRRGRVGLVVELGPALQGARVAGTW